MEERDKKERKINIRKAVKIGIITIITITIIIFISLYIVNDNFRKWIDVNLLRKEISTEDVATIDLDINKNNQVYAFSKYIVVLSNKTLSLYNNSGNKISDIDTEFNKVVFDSSDKYLAIAEEGGKNFNIIFDKNYMWSGTEEGNISQIHINSNGYVAVISSDNTHKSIVSVYDSSGKLMFKTYFASTRIIDLSISKDNKKIAVGELDIAGTLIQSNVKIISVENAQTKDKDAIIYTYNAEKDKILMNITYQSNDEIICMYNDSIEKIKNDQKETIFNVNNSKITFLSTELNNHFVYVEEQVNGIFDKDSILHIINTGDMQENIYKLDGVVKQLSSSNGTIVANIGTDIYFFNNRGWLIKKYSSNKEISNFIFSDNIVGIVYKDKIEIINL